MAENIGRKIFEVVARDHEEGIADHLFSMHCMVDWSNMPITILTDDDSTHTSFIVDELKVAANK